MRCLQNTPLRIRGDGVPPRPMARTSAQRRHARSLVRAAASEAGGSKPNGALVKALEGALAAVSKIVTEAERKRRAKVGADGTVAAEVESKMKQVSFKASSSNDRLVKAPHLPGRSLSDYLALPLDAYSLLDPTWISRDPTDPNTFLLVVPLQALTGLDLEPRIYIRVDLDSDDAQVRFHATRFSVGQPKFDSNFKLDLRARLQNRSVPEVSVFNIWGGNSRTHKKEQQQQQEAEPTVANADGAMAAAGAASRATSAVDPVVVVEGEGQQVPNNSGRHGATQQRGSEASTASTLAATLETPLVDASAPASASTAAAVPVAATTDLGDSSKPSGTNGAAGHASAPPASPDGNGGSAGPSSAAAGASSSLAGEAEAGAGADAAGNVSELTESSGLLWCSVDVKVDAMVPHPLSAVPGPLLNLTCSLLTKFTIQQLLPGFLQLLSVDYTRWAAGQSRNNIQPAGSLLSDAMSVRRSASVVDVEAVSVSGLSDTTVHVAAPATVAAVPDSQLAPK